MAKPTVGMLGLGIMGSAMAENLIKARFKVIGYDPVALCRKRHRQAGGTLAENVEDVAHRTSIVISSLPSAKALIANAKGFPKTKKQIVIETSTLPIAAKEQARKLFAAKGVTLLDCPLSGTGAQARSGDLAVYGSGKKGSYQRVIPVLKGFSRTQYYLGEFGNGSRMKFAANLLVAIHNVSAAEAVILARRSGLNAALAVKVLGDGAGTSRMLQVRGPMMARRRYTPATMSIKLWQKDMKIIGDFVRELGSPAPLFAATKAIYNAALAQGRARQDTAAVNAVLESRRKR